MTRVFKTLFIALLLAFVIPACRGQEKKPAEPAVQPKGEIVNGFKTWNPDPIEGIDTNYVEKLVDILGSDAINQKQKDSIVDQVWYAYTDPLNFDSIYRDFSINCMGLVSGRPPEEQKPYLMEWSNSMSDLQYFRLVLSRALSCNHLVGNGDDTDGVTAAMYWIKQTHDLVLPKYNDNENARQYLRRLNSTALSQIDKKALVEKTYPDIYVCDMKDVPTLINLLSKIKVELVKP